MPTWEIITGAIAVIAMFWRQSQVALAKRFAEL